MTGRPVSHLTKAYPQGYLGWVRPEEGVSGQGWPEGGVSGRGWPEGGVSGWGLSSVHVTQMWA